jgi:hypothetical protein
MVLIKIPHPQWSMHVLGSYFTSFIIKHPVHIHGTVPASSSSAYKQIHQTINRLLFTQKTQVGFHLQKYEIAFHLKTVGSLPFIEKNEVVFHLKNN